MFEDEPHADGAAVVAAAGEALQALCQELNLDEGSAAEALDDFTAIRGNYSLEGAGLSCPLRSPALSRECDQSQYACLVNVAGQGALYLLPVGNFRMIGDDLVNSYHLLLCCLDLIFANAIVCPNRRDLLNPSFKGLPSDFHTADFRASEEPPCIIAVLCELHDGLLVEAKGIKEHYFKPYISKLFDRKILKGECLLDLSSFTDNSKAVNKEYEEYVLTVGDFDERIFLGADAEEEIGTPRKFTGDTPLGKLTAQANVEYNLQQHFEKKRTFAPSTPLTGRRYLREQEAIITPVASATQSVSRLQSTVAGLKNAPSEQLINIFESCTRNPKENIMKIVKGIGETFCQHYTQSTDEQPGSHIDFAINRLKLAEILYYKMLETVMVQETRRLHGMDMSVIEVVIRSEEGLSRDMVKHLNSIEEQILESLAWSHNSALWETLQASANKVPTCEEVIFPNNFETGNGGNVQGHLPMMPMSPIMHPRVKEVRTDSGSLRRDMQPLSPISVHERYSSPTAGSAKRRLFGEDPPKEVLMDKILTEGTKLKIAPSSSITTENISISPGQTLLTMATATVTGTTRHKVTIPLHGVANDAGEITLIPISMNTIQESNIESPVSITAHSLIGASPKHIHLTKAQEVHLTGISKPKRTGSLALFYRKVYRSVLLKSVPKEVVAYNNDINGDFEMTDGDLENATKTPNCPNGPVKEERGDLIKFYNTIYVGRVKSFALKYDLSNQDHVMDAPPLSPFPHIKQQPGSPRRISQQHSIYVSPHKNGSGLTPRSALLYKFNGSPSKSLKDINNMIRQGEQRTKKRAIAISGDAESPAKRLCQENDDVLLKRLQDVVSERANH
ncbi:Retinoblastoma-like protein 1 [Sciurus carolinensis]|uniref:Retinoblastoma-like protein 1 n=1 Tax=Sciurus carolinensis TaxID=30640 RepID=A0AA41MI74_SCICA|nr:Retinoblastoma-like protein 1 [Sciurus carolinensis]